eukprot:1906147-Amphidinium_carterae.1
MCIRDSLSSALLRLQCQQLHASGWPPKQLQLQCSSNTAKTTRLVLRAISVYTAAEQAWAHHLDL